MKRNYLLLLLFGILILSLTGCIPASSLAGIPTDVNVAVTQAAPWQTAEREAQVESVEVQIIQSDPVQVNAIVRGNLTESCATLSGSQTTYASNTFQIKLMTKSPTDRGCAQVTTPYERTIPLDMSGLTSDTYIVIVNGVSTSFYFPSGDAQVPTPIHLVVSTADQTIQVIDLNIPLDPTNAPFIEGMLASGGSAGGVAYVLDSTDQIKVEAVGANGEQELSFIHNPTNYGLAIWRGSSDAQFHIAWGTQLSGLDQSSSLMFSSLDGSQVEKLLTEGSSTQPTQLVAEFWSADGQSLYFSKEPVGLGGYILYSGASDLYKIDITTKEVTAVIPMGPSTAPQACLDAISVDYRYVADHCSQNSITVRDLLSGGTTSVQAPNDLSGFKLVGSARFSPDDSRLAYALAKGEQASEQGWVAVSDGFSGGSKLVLTSESGAYYTVAGWLDDQTLLVQSTKPNECTPYCKSELWTVDIDGTKAQKVADGSLLAVITGDVNPVPKPSTQPTQEAGICQDAAEYISDDGLDGTAYAPNTAFSKTWTVKNTGTCTWDSKYLVFQISGALMTQQPGYWLVPQGQAVAPGQTVNISVGMTSPVENGSYTAYWGLKNADGQIIPIKGGADGNSFYVKIKVNDGTASAGEVTATTIDIVPEQGSGDACTANSTYFVHATISVDGPTSVSYEIGSSAGQISAGYFQNDDGTYPYVTGTLDFAKAETKTTSLRFVGPYPYPKDISILLRVNNGKWSSVKLNCP